MPDASTQTSPQPEPCFNPFASTSSLQRPATKPRRGRQNKPKGKPVFTVRHGCFTLFGTPPPPAPPAHEKIMKKKDT